MKHFLLLLFISYCLLFTATETFGQCTANAGNDTTLCIYIGTETFLGGSPAVIGGTSPYTYSWSAYYTLPPLHFTASLFLDDTTAANPKLVDHLFDTLAFSLTVTDSLGYTCHDTVVIRLCKYLYISTVEHKRIIEQGDTAYIGIANGNGCPPYSYQWSPDYNISDPTVETPKVWPDTTTFYSAIITDAAGCESSGTFRVYVTPTSINEREVAQTDIDIYPNPVNSHTTIKISGPIIKDLTVEFYDNLGRKLREISIEDNETKVDLSNVSSGIYFYRLMDKDKTIGLGKLVVQ